MADSHELIESALADVKKGIKLLQRGNGKQVRSLEELAHLKSIALAWFRNYREEALRAGIQEGQFLEVDDAHKTILNAVQRSSSRATYSDSLGRAKTALSELLTSVVVAPAAPKAPLVEAPPQFGPLAADPKMQEILIRRWEECQRCLIGGAPLAATVMMGGLLEALCVARVNKMPDKAPLFKSKSAPLDRDKKPIPLSEWTLRPFLDFAHEIGWIPKSAKDVGAVLRDYRNYVHPQKEYSHGVILKPAEAMMFWDVTKHLCRQILAS